MIDLPALVTRSYGTSGCVELTDEVIEQLADQAEQGYPMERLPRRREERFNQVAGDLIRRVMPEIPEEYREGFEYMMVGGEYAMAVDDLVAVVADHRIQLSPADAETLRALGAGQHGEAPPTSLLAGTIPRNERREMPKKYRPGSDRALVQETILRGLQDGTYAPGSLMPYGNYFAAEHNVSVNTVKAVMRDLVDEGWLIPRGQGKEHRVHPQPPTEESSG